MERKEIVGTPGATPVPGDSSVTRDHSSKQRGKRKNNNGIRK